MRKIVVGAAAAAMVLGSSAAQAAPMAADRAGSPVQEAEGISGAPIWLALLAAGMLAFILIQIGEDDDTDLPVSP